ncbi:MAG: hypothetical protein JRD68_12290, partial [Deltaproteobacteria bacterium]|nr:hypothetical protein [Deltaproteobacteria bacterium]
MNRRERIFLTAILGFMLTPLCIGNAADTNIRARIDQADSLYAQRDNPEKVRAA